MNKTFKEQYHEEQELESSLAKGWGYSLSRPALDKSDKKQIANDIPVVANITLRKFGKEIVKTDKIKQVEDEIRALQNQRILRQLREVKQEASIEEKSEIIIMMQKLIEKYNDIIEHKHLMSTSTQLKPKDNQQSQQESEHKIFFKKIQEKKALLLSGDINQQIKLNKQIAQQYRQYKLKLESIAEQSLKKNASLAKQAPVSERSMRKYQSQAFQKKFLASIGSAQKAFSLQVTPSDQKLKEIPKQLKYTPNEIDGKGDSEMVKKYRQLQLKKYAVSQQKQQQSFEVNEQAISDTYPIKQSQSKHRKSHRRLQQIVPPPFMDKKQIEQFKAVENKIRSTSEALDNWKAKVHDFSSNSALMRNIQQASRIKEISSIQQQANWQNRELQIEKAIQKQVKMINIAPISDKVLKNNKAKERQRLRNQERESIFAQLLKKRHSKFSRLWGTKILVQYDSVAEAKSLLKGQADTNPTKIVQNSPNPHSRASSNIKSKANRRQEATPLSARGLSELGDSYDWREEQGDQEHYWRMCRNQKINLLLKRH